MKTEIGIKEKDRKSVKVLLTTILSDEMVLLVKTKNFHWNVTGSNFNELHSFFQQQYSLLETAVDEIAERIRMLGFYSIGSMDEFLKSATLKENKQVKESDKMLAELLSDYETSIKYLRIVSADCVQKYNDTGTNDFLIGLMQVHEKSAWMIRSYFK